MKNTFLKYATLVAVALASIQSLHATPIVGTIGFTGRVALDTGSTATASKVVAWVNPKVNGTSGDFSSLADGTAVSIKSPWNFASGSITKFWTCGAFTFDLTSSKIISQGGIIGISGFVNVSGVGVVHNVGFDDTIIIWNFSSQDPRIIGSPDSFTFSVSQVTTVPDGAVTIALLGLALTSASLLRRQFAA